jgi:subtilisin family serine protease
MLEIRDSATCRSPRKVLRQRWRSRTSDPVVSRRFARVRAVALFTLMLVGGAVVARAGTLDPAVAARLDRPAQAAQRPIAVIIELEGRPDLARIATTVNGLPAGDRPGALALALRSAFERSATNVRTALDHAGAMQIEPLWIAHGFAAQLPPSAVRRLAAQPGVARITLDMQLRAPVRAAPTSMRAVVKRERPAAPSQIYAPPMVDPVAWRGELPSHLNAVGAAAYWQRGVTGKGIVVAVVDSGVDGRDVPLMAKFRGGPHDWFDPYAQRARPFDGVGHGTHVAYVIAGGAATEGGPPVGVAPHSQWIAARIYDDAGLGRLSALHRTYQWVLDPDGRPETADAPAIVNNSWGLPQTVGRCEREFARDFDALRAAGIHVVFAAGNDGPAANTSMSPANNPGVLAIGALTADGKVADQSGRGPSACDGSAYPQAYAPGVNVESIDAAGRVLGEPLRVTGTSFAAALASGVLALLASEDPARPLVQREHDLANALASSDKLPELAKRSPTALTWRPDLGAGDRLEINAQTLQAVLPWTARLLRVEIEARPMSGQIETLSADRVRYVADQAADSKAGSFTLVAHTADKRSWRIVVEPQFGASASTVASRRVSLATRGSEPIELTRAQLAGETAYESIRASQTIRGGRVDVHDDGSVRYTPRTGFRGVDQFVCTLLAADGAARERVQVAVTVR